MATVPGRGTCGGHVTLLCTVEDRDEDPIRQASSAATWSNRVIIEVFDSE
jgi:hypothetical protein